ncbi:MAG: IS256 family transposase [Pyrinomonadaceae bacterium]
MPIDSEIIDKLLKDYKSPEAVLGENGLLKQFTKAILERAMAAELTPHLGYEPLAPEGKNSGNSRNGAAKNTLKGDFGELQIETPRDRNSTFEPQIVKKGETRFSGCNDKILSLYARGLSTREIQQPLEEIYSVEVSPALISQVTDAVQEEVTLWQSRPLAALYPSIYLDALQVKIRDGAHVRNKASSLVLGINLQGLKEVLGLWSEQTEGAKFWLQILTDLRNRGVRDIFIACVAGLKGFPEVIETLFPQAQVQRCIVHLVRQSLQYVGYKERKAVAAALQRIYRSATREEAEVELDRFAEKWDAKFPTIAQTWRRNWERIVVFFAYPPEIRRVIYTTNAIESTSMSLRKVLKTRGSFPSDEAALKLIYLALQNITARWTMPIKDWRAALNRFAILFAKRMPVTL